MKNQIHLILAATIIAGAVSRTADASSADTTKTYPTPVLLTSCGQAADVLMIKGLGTRAGLDFRYRPHATGDSLSDVKSVIMVAGGSSKGLGAAKADPEKEIKRSKALLSKAHKAKLPVIVIHLGGEARRGVLSDPFNKIAAEGADLLAVVKGGDEDSLFKKIADERKITYIPLEKQADAATLLRSLFGLDSVKTAPPPSAQ